MTVVKIILVGYTVLRLLYWLWMLYVAVSLLAELNLPEPKPSPRLAVVVPAGKVVKF